MQALCWESRWIESWDAIKLFRPAGNCGQSPMSGSTIQPDFWKGCSGSRIAVLRTHECRIYYPDRDREFWNCSSRDEMRPWP